MSMSIHCGVALWQRVLRTLAVYILLDNEICSIYANEFYCKLERGRRRDIKLFVEYNKQCACTAAMTCRSS